MSQLKRIVRVQTKPISTNSVVSFDIKPYGTLDEIVLCFTNNGAAATQANILTSINQILFTVNGETVHSCDISQLYDVYRYAGQQVNQFATAPNTVSLNVGRYLFKSEALRDLFSFGTIGIDSIQLQVFCSGEITGITDVGVTSVRRAFDSVFQGSFVKCINYPQSFNATGTDEVDTLPRDSTDSYIAVIADAAGGTISEIACVANGQYIIDPTRAEVVNQILACRGYSPLSGQAIFPFADGSGRSVMPMQGITEFRQKPTFSVAPPNGKYSLLAISVRNTPPQMLSAALSNAV